jgi:hypothetical protein
MPPPMTRRMRRPRIELVSVPIEADLPQQG